MTRRLVSSREVMKQWIKMCADFVKTRVVCNRQMNNLRINHVNEKKYDLKEYTEQSNVYERECSVRWKRHLEKYQQMQLNLFMQMDGYKITTFSFSW